MSSYNRISMVLTMAMCLSFVAAACASSDDGDQESVGVGEVTSTEGVTSTEETAPSEEGVVGAAEPIKILEWNITGGSVADNRAIVAEVFSTEDADIIALQETGRGAAAIAEILEPTHVLVAELNGQEIWVRDSGRFITLETNLFHFDGGCNGFNLGSPSVTLEDTQSDGELLYVYSSHFCIPDGFGRPSGGSGDRLPDISNENQQQHLCSFITSMEGNANTGTVVLAADFNDIRLAEGESLISFLQGSGTLNAGFCEDTAIGMVDVVSTDVTHIVGTGNEDMYRNQRAVRSTEIGFGQHGYVVISIDLTLAGGSSQ